MLTTYVDESLRRRTGDHGVYAMAAVIADAADCDAIRVMLESLRVGKSPRLHWRDETPSRRLLVAQRLSTMPITSVVTVHLHHPATRIERARRRCLEELLVELSQAGVARVTVECRTPAQDHMDLLLLMGVRKSRGVSRRMVVDWRPSHADPMLWAADAVVGATTWWLDGQPEYFEQIRDRAHVICLD